MSVCGFLHSCVSVRSWVLSFLKNTSLFFRLLIYFPVLLHLSSKQANLIILLNSLSHPYWSPSLYHSLSPNCISTDFLLHFTVARLYSSASTGNSWGGAFAHRFPVSFWEKQSMLSHHGEMITARQSCGWRLACLQAVGVLNEHVLLSKRFEVDISQWSCKMIFMLDLSNWIQVPSGCCRFLFWLIRLGLYIHAIKHVKLMFVCLWANSMNACIDTPLRLCVRPTLSLRASSPG